MAPAAVASMQAAAGTTEPVPGEDGEGSSDVSDSSGMPGSSAS